MDFIRKYFHTLKMKYFLALFLVFFFSLPASAEGPVFPQNRLTADEFSDYFHEEKTKVEKLAPCYKAYREYEWRVRYWSSIFRSLIKEKKFQVEDLEKIDFLLPGEAGFGDDPENEFFNLKGKFKGTPIPQEVIDDMTTSKNTRLIFNVRGETGKGYDHSTDLPYIDSDVLVVILPNLLTQCPAEVLPTGSIVYAWNERFLKKRQDEIYIAPDNKTIVKDEEPIEGWRFTDAKRSALISALASRPKPKRLRDNK